MVFIVNFYSIWCWLSYTATHTLGVDVSDGNSPLLQRSSSSRRSSATLTTSASISSFQHAQHQHAGYSPPSSPGPKDVRTHSILRQVYNHINLPVYHSTIFDTLCFADQGPSDGCNFIHVHLLSQTRRGKHLKLSHLDAVQKMKVGQHTPRWHTASLTCLVTGESISHQYLHLCENTSDHFMYYIQGDLCIYIYIL